MGLIELENVYKSFFADARTSLRTLFSSNTTKQKRILVLKDISFEVEEGELLGILGKNGVGKSTLLRMVGGIYEQDSGKLITNGEIVSIFEMGTFFNPELTGEQYCKDYLRFRGLKKKKLAETIESVYEFTEIGGFFYKPVRTYSSGMQAKLLFGVATALPAKIILIDEVLVVGDMYFQGRAWKRLRQFLSGGASGIIVTHDWTSVLKLCKRSIILSNNGLEFIGDSCKTIQKYLDLPGLKESDEITFLNKDKMLKEVVLAKTGESFSYNFQVKVLKNINEGAMGLVFTVERHIEGIGWTLLMVGHKNVNTNGKIINISFTIEDFCVAPGEYFMALGIYTPRKLGYQGPADKIYEQLTWLSGNPIKLLVQGKNESNQLFRKKLQWKIV